MSELHASIVLNMLRSLPPQERLKVIAQALPEIADSLPVSKAARTSPLGICADLGLAPGKEQIDEARIEMWAAFSNV